MRYDSQGLQITTDSTAASNAINRFIHQALVYGRDAETSILEAVAADPDCAIAHAYTAAYYLSQESAVDRHRATFHLDSARHHSSSATQREQLYIQAIAAWATGHMTQAIALHTTLAEQFPQDLLSVQQGQYHYFYQGDKTGLLHIVETVLPENANNPYWLGMTAFALEQCHRLAEAEALGRQAIALERHNPWAHHAVAHVMEMQGRSQDGIAWMESFAPLWDDCNSMLYTHNWWHVALFYLAEGDLQQALALYDQHVWGKARPDSAKDQVGAIALLLRLELQGAEVQPYWQQLTPHLLPRLHEHALPFQDLHYIYALARADQRHLANEMLASMAAHTQALPLSQRRVWTEIVIPAAQGLMAHASGHWHQAIAHLKPVLPHLWQVGGSHAQRQLFKQVYRNAQLRGDRYPHVRSPFRLSA
ncbi:MAG: tetratricopeptide repeat protein [Oculatellaceae cyanobacterium bins.114]|nr:tetratricopeptide repeat protein [Oculatellaceae cyanobacterium bins.114]